MPADPLDWWRRALAGEKPPITSEPHAGWYKRKLVKGGPWVAAAIWWHGPVDADGEPDGDEVLLCAVDGTHQDPEEQWTYLAANPITEQEYRYLCALRAYAQAHDSAEPLAEPRKAIDRLTAPIPTFKKRKRN